MIKEQYAPKCTKLEYARIKLTVQSKQSEVNRLITPKINHLRKTWNPGLGGHNEIESLRSNKGKWQTKNYPKIEWDIQHLEP